MIENTNPARPLDRLTPELAAEVRRNLAFWSAIAVGVAALFSALFAFAVDPGVSGVTGGVAVLMFALFLGLLVPYIGLLLALAYLFDCWPALLRSRQLQDRYGVAPEVLTGTAWRRAMGSGGFWAAFTQGAIVGWAFGSAIMLAWWGLSGKWGFIVPSIMLTIWAGQLAARSWFVRQAVERAEAPAAHQIAPVL